MKAHSPVCWIGLVVVCTVARLELWRCRSQSNNANYENKHTKLEG
jgi:hypothetical protein